MAKREVPIEEATLEELRTFARVNLAIEVPNLSNRQQVISRIRQGNYKEEFILVSAGPASAVPEAPMRTALTMRSSAPQKVHKVRTHGPSARDPRVVLMIPTQDHPGGQRPVPVSVNGDQLLITRGIMVELPYRYFMVLRDAVRTSWSMNEDTKEILGREVQEYPFQIYSVPSEEVVNDWLMTQLNDDALDTMRREQDLLEAHVMLDSPTP